MAIAGTERMHETARGLDTRDDLDIVGILLAGQTAATEAVRPALPEIARAARLCAEALAGGGRLGYVAAGSSGLMALADGLELPGTYGIARDRIAILIAGGAAALQSLPGGPEDDSDQARADIDREGLGTGDCVIGISASGTTPYAVAGLAAARRNGAATIAIANNPGAALFSEADAAILLLTPPEVIAGSTRMGAATAQKVALNLISTLTAIRLGHVHDGHMVNLLADNRKLRARALRIVAAIAGCDESAAADCLDAAGGSVKPAILMAAGVDDPAAARSVLEATGGHVRPALSKIARESIFHKNRPPEPAPTGRLT